MNCCEISVYSGELKICTCTPLGFRFECIEKIIRFKVVFGKRGRGVLKF